MKDKIIDAIGGIDDDMIESADALRGQSKKRIRKWVKWAAAAACICIIAAAAIPLINRSEKNDPPAEGTPAPAEQSAAPKSLADRLSDCGIEAQAVSDPELIAAHEMPRVRKEDIIQSIRANLTVQGTVSCIESVRITDADTVWYITTVNISTDEVLSGMTEKDSVSIVCAAAFTGVPESGQTIPAPGLADCENGTNGVFVLHETGKDAWQICGSDVYPESLGDYYIVYHLERSGDLLVFADQRIELTVDEIR